MYDLFNLKGRVAIVTGGTSGLGADAALAYARAGADVVLCYLEESPGKLQELTKKICHMGRRVLGIPCDITKEENVKNAIDQVMKEFGHIDILLNNAGVAVNGGVENLSEEDWNRSFDINVKGAYLTAKYVIPHMKKEHYGKVVNISSVNAKVADKNDMFIRHSYNASKAAVLGLTVGMACSYARYGITVNAVGPGLFETEMTAPLFRSEQFINGYSTLTPANRPAEKGELNGTILYLSSDASKYVQGQYIIVDGGASSV